MLREVSLRLTHPTLRTEIGYVQQASYCAALIEQVTERETPLPEIFELMHRLLDVLPAQPPRPQTIFAFELKLLEALGQQPDLADAKLTPGAKLIAGKLWSLDWPDSARVKPSAAQIRELQLFLHNFLVRHLEKIPASRAMALGV